MIPAVACSSGPLCPLVCIETVQSFIFLESCFSIIFELLLFFSSGHLLHSTCVKFLQKHVSGTRISAVLHTCACINKCNLGSVLFWGKSSNQCKSFFPSLDVCFHYCAVVSVTSLHFFSFSRGKVDSACERITSDQWGRFKKTPVVFFSRNKQWCGLPREDCHFLSTAQPPREVVLSPKRC